MSASLADGAVDGEVLPPAPKRRTPAEMDELAAAARAAHAATEQAVKDVVKLARATGGILIGAKAGMRHGEFLTWLDRTTSIARRKAQTCKQLARELPRLPSAKAQRVARLSLRSAIAELARRSRKAAPPLPPPARGLTDAPGKALARAPANPLDLEGCTAGAAGTGRGSAPAPADPTAPPLRAELVGSVLEHVRSYRRDRPGVTAADLRGICRRLEDGGGAAAERREAVRWR